MGAFVELMHTVRAQVGEVVTKLPEFLFGQYVWFLGSLSAGLSRKPSLAEYAKRLNVLVLIYVHTALRFGAFGARVAFLHRP